MEVLSTNHYLEFNSEDQYGKFTIRIHKDCSQLTLESQNGNEQAFVDINRNELAGIRDMINQILE